MNRLSARPGHTKENPGAAAGVRFRPGGPEAPRPRTKEGAAHVGPAAPRRPKMVGESRAAEPPRPPRPRPGTAGGAPAAAPGEGFGPPPPTSSTSGEPASPPPPVVGGENRSTTPSVQGVSPWEGPAPPGQTKRDAAPEGPRGNRSPARAGPGAPLPTCSAGSPRPPARCGSRGTPPASCSPPGRTSASGSA